MKAVMLVRAYNEETKERGEVACLEVPKPELVHGDDVLIKVASCGVCGSDGHVHEKDKDGYINFAWLTPVSADSRTRILRGDRGNRKGRRYIQGRGLCDGRGDAVLRILRGVPHISF